MISTLYLVLTPVSRWVSYHARISPRLQSANAYPSWCIYQHGYVLTDLTSQPMIVTYKAHMRVSPPDYAQEVRFNELSVYKETLNLIFFQFIRLPQILHLVRAPNFLTMHFLHITLT